MNDYKFSNNVIARKHTLNLTPQRKYLVTELQRVTKNDSITV